MLKIIAMVLVFSSLAFGFTGTGQVVGVTDGDTLTILTQNNRKLRVRLFGVDAPEKGQPFSAESTENLTGLCAGQIATVAIMDNDRYGRLIAVVYCQGVNANIDQVSRGLVWVYRYFLEKEQPTREINDYFDAELMAKQSGIGLWSEADPIPPWEHRKRK